MGNARSFLKARKTRTTTYSACVVDEAVLEAAEAELAAARRAAHLVAIAKDEAQQAEADARLEAARQAVAECVDTLTFHNLPAHEFEALMSAHEPSKTQQANGEQWNADTFPPALIAACCQDSDLTEDEWAAELSSDRWSLADRNAIFSAALSANIAPRSVTIPKG